MAAPSHHNPPTCSRKTSTPNTAVTKKFADVLVMETLVVEGEAVRARVKRAHMMMLQRRLRAKQSCFVS